MFSVKNIQTISPWFYNCGLGTLVPYLLQYLCPSIASLKMFKETKPSAKRAARLKKTSGYKQLRESFLELYIRDAQKRKHIIDNNQFESVLSELFTMYPKALQQTIILGPVLRLTLQKTLQQSNNFKKGLWPQFTALTHRCLAHIQKNNSLDSYVPEDNEEELFKANQSVIQQIVTILNTPTHPENSSYQTIFTSELCPNAFLPQWDATYSTFCAHIGSMEKLSFLSIDHLGLLYRSFGFHLFYATDSKFKKALSVYNQAPKCHLQDVTIINQSKNHWELVCSNSHSIWDGDTLLESDPLYNVYALFFLYKDEHPQIVPSLTYHLELGIQYAITHKKKSFFKDNTRKINKTLVYR